MLVHFLSVCLLPVFLADQQLELSDKYIDIQLFIVGYFSWPWTDVYGEALLLVPGNLLLYLMQLQNDSFFSNWNYSISSIINAKQLKVITSNRNEVTINKFIKHINFWHEKLQLLSWNKLLDLLRVKTLFNIFLMKLWVTMCFPTFIWMLVTFQMFWV